MGVNVEIPVARYLLTEQLFITHAKTLETADGWEKRENKTKKSGEELPLKV